MRAEPACRRLPGRVRTCLLHFFRTLPPSPCTSEGVGQGARALDMLQKLARELICAQKETLPPPRSTSHSRLKKHKRNSKGFILYTRRVSKESQGGGGFQLKPVSRSPSSIRKVRAKSRPGQTQEQGCNQYKQEKGEHVNQGEASSSLSGKDR